MPRILRIITEVSEMTDGLTTGDLVEVDEEGKLKTLWPEGYIRVDVFGRTIFDCCASEEEHRLAPPATIVTGTKEDGIPETDTRRRCSIYLEDLFAAHKDKKVKLLVTIGIQEVGK